MKKVTAIPWRDLYRQFGVDASKESNKLIVNNFRKKSLQWTSASLSVAEAPSNSCFPQRLIQRPDTQQTSIGGEPASIELSHYFSVRVKWQVDLAD